MRYPLIFQTSKLAASIFSPEKCCYVRIGASFSASSVSTGQADHLKSGKGGALWVQLTHLEKQAGERERERQVEKALRDCNEHQYLLDSATSALISLGARGN